MSATPGSQLEDIHEWLRDHKFRCSDVSGSPTETIWGYESCEVRVRQGMKGNCYVDLRRRIKDAEWSSLQDILTQFPPRAHLFVRPPIENAVTFLLDGVTPKPPLGKRLYSACKPGAYAAKVALQMLIGIGTIPILCWALITVSSGHHVQGLFRSEAQASILVITAALAAAGAIELAYTLYTPGPDEALDPLMLGLSAGILLVVTRTDLTVGWQFLGIILGVAALGVLFVIKRKFIGSDES